MKFRTGTKLDRTLYLQLGDAPDTRRPEEGGDLLIGLLDPGWGPAITEALNDHAFAFGGPEGLLIFVDPPVYDAVIEAVNRRRAEVADE